jgi:hypothetical protein
MKSTIGSFHVSQLKMMDMATDFASSKESLDSFGCVRTVGLQLDSD